MTLREQIEKRNSQWRAFHEWEAAQPLTTRQPAAILADLGTILSWLPSEARETDPDPDKHGIEKMRAALTLLRRE